MPRLGALIVLKLVLAETFLLTRIGRQRKATNDDFRQVRGGVEARAPSIGEIVKCLAETTQREEIDECSCYREARGSQRRLLASSLAERVRARCA